MDAPVTSMEGAEASLSGHVLLGRYQLGERLGRGELGDVYAADDLLRRSISDEAAVAVKVFRPSLVSACGGVGTLAPMLATACRLSHPNVINAFDFYKDGGTLFLAMERLSGGTLAEQLATLRGGPPLSVTNADAALREVVDALVYIHAATQRPLLRLNPQRLWLAGESRQLRVADLGLSSLIDQTLLCQSAMTTGMSAYLAPEVVAVGQAPDCRSDQFSLGAIAMTLFTGSPRGSVEGMHKALGRPGAAIWVDLLPRLLAEAPDERFRDMAELQEILVGAAATTRGRWMRLIRPVAGVDGSAIGGGNRRSVLTWSPLALAATGVLGLGLAMAAWAFGPRLLFRDHWKSLATTQVDEARFQLHEFDALRMDLMTKGLNRQPFDAGVRHLALAAPDYALVDSLRSATDGLRVGDHESAQVHLSSVRASLDERTEQLNAAITSIDACDRLMELRETADSLNDLVNLAVDGAVEQIDQHWRAAAEDFGRGAFGDAAATASEAAKRAEVAIENSINERRSEAHEARDAWRAALRSIGAIPEIEPIGEPGKRIAAGDVARAAGDRVEAARCFTGAHDRYRDWLDEFARNNPEAIRVAAPDSPEVDPEQRAAGQLAFTNSIGMKFLPVGDLMASIWETRLIDFLAFTRASGVDAGYQWRDFAVTGTTWRGGDDDRPAEIAPQWGDYSVTPVQGPCHPVTFISVADAQRFCEWLTQRERQAGLIRADQVYRLPSDLEWSRLAGLDDDPEKTPRERSFDHPSHFPWGRVPQRRAGSGNYATWPSRATREVWVDEQDKYLHTSPVGTFGPNVHGLYDIGGNVWERTSDALYGVGSEGGGVIRGAGWRSLDLDTMRTACRDGRREVSPEVGFRVVLAPESTNDENRDGKQPPADSGNGD